MTLRQKIMISLGLLALGAGPSILMAADAFVGVETCKYCHQAQYEAWKKGPHSGALFVLNNERRKDSKCLGCHTTGTEAGLQSVQCESCHGGGEYYSKYYIMKDVELARAVGLKVSDFSYCLRCHEGDLPNVRPFDPKIFWKRLPHSKTSGK